MTAKEIAKLVLQSVEADFKRAGQKMRLRDLSSATVPCPEMRGRGWCITSAIEKKKVAKVNN